MSSFLGRLGLFGQLTLLNFFQRLQRHGATLCQILASPYLLLVQKPVDLLLPLGFLGRVCLPHAHFILADSYLQSPLLLLLVNLDLLLILLTIGEERCKRT